jgi:hypothetical protein
MGAMHGGMDESLGLFGRGHGVVVNPAALLTDVGHLKQVGIEASALDSPAECPLVHTRTAGGNHDAGELVFKNVLGDHLLPRIGTHVLV